MSLATTSFSQPAWFQCAQLPLLTQHRAVQHCVSALSWNSSRWSSIGSGSTEGLSRRRSRKEEEKKMSLFASADNESRAKKCVPGKYCHFCLFVSHLGGHRFAAVLTFHYIFLFLTAWNPLFLCLTVTLFCASEMPLFTLFFFLKVSVEKNARQIERGSTEH